MRIVRERHASAGACLTYGDGLRCGECLTCPPKDEEPEPLERAAPVPREELSDDDIPW